MKTIHSIEPLSQSQLSNIISKTGVEVTLIDRNSFLEQREEHPRVNTLICRDRDNISDIIEVCNNLKLLFVVSTGVERLPFEKLAERNITVCNTGGINAEIMSQYVMAYILAQKTRVYENYKNQIRHYWKKYQSVESLVDSNLLIVGAGKIGQNITSKAVQYGINCIGIKKHVKSLPYFDEVVSLKALDEKLSSADYVVCTMPSTPYTKKIFDYDRFCAMKETALFINISRGNLVVTEDLIKALNKRKISAAVLDVFEDEPLTVNNNLWDIPNLFITPHSSGRLEDFLDKAIECFIHNYKAFVSEATIPNKVNLSDGY